MCSQGKQNLSIGVFYDGNFFFHVSNYYFRSHSRGQRLSIRGLHNYICAKVAENEDVDKRYCNIVDAHYFRGRLSATEAKERDSLYTERSFDQVLIRERVTPHYLPLAASGEKGIDVWLALEAYELAIIKKLDVVVLIAGDGDFIPLAKKVNSLGTRVMVLGWDFKHEDQHHVLRETVTSSSLLDEVAYPMRMDQLIENPAEADIDLIDSIFVEKGVDVDLMSQSMENFSDGTGVIKYINKSLKDKCGYGFIARPNCQDDLYFYCSDVMDVGFDNIKIGDVVEFELGENDRGVCARKVKLLD